MKQRTIRREASIRGKALHTGTEVTLTIKPAKENVGIVFRRMDLYNRPEICPSVDAIGDLIRCTTITSGHVKVHTVEHILSAIYGMNVDNIIIEMDASEPPILDGSAKFFANLINEAEPIEQEEDRVYCDITKPISVTRGNRSMIALPYDGFKITCTSSDDRGIHTQHLSIDLDPEVYLSEVAPARTFTIYEDIEELLKLGKIQGGSLDSAIVIKGDKILSKEPLRFADEFVRHKVLDVVGDLALVGMPIRGHIIAVRPGHALNAELTRGIVNSYNEAKTGKKKMPQTPAGPVVINEEEACLDIKQVLNTLPHRYPFVLIDRVVEFIGDTELRAIKNVTINEPYFVGHFPGQPVMPGVLQIEAMAQAAGLLMMRRGGIENKLAYFMSCDKVKFRKAVVPGDQLEICVKLLKRRGDRIGIAEAQSRVNGKVVSSAELMFSIVDHEE
ncbi:MAG: bifunctional UDP-3-O-[3-hydroxymyristoyl] N-acetylglucosamine deacetylase/3-hydroxyacyl-ACP dehydratase [Puniceicoccales bacterium]|nr:bifunctional UDP-3-O-[3-hydroxymyristoyl] N-acetylglucosamine deacetylase/3-hydroxyacyl-ACP dehydratase [Puniceicoccales bacterium]